MLRTNRHRVNRSELKADGCPLIADG